MKDGESVGLVVHRERQCKGKVVSEIGKQARELERMKDVSLLPLDSVCRSASNEAEKKKSLLLGL